MSNQLNTFNDEMVTFVNATSSVETSNNADMITRIQELDSSESVPYARLLTSSLGMMRRSGEMSDQIKDMTFGGADYDQDVIMDSLGYIFWNMYQAAIALDVSIVDISERSQQNYSYGQTTALPDPSDESDPGYSDNVTN